MFWLLKFIVGIVVMLHREWNWGLCSIIVLPTAAIEILVYLGKVLIKTSCG